MKKRKETMVGYTYNNWKFERKAIFGEELVLNGCGTNILEEKSPFHPTKIRITIEEI